MSECLRDHELAEVVDPPPSPQVQQRLEDHVGGCARCRLMVAALLRPPGEPERESKPKSERTLVGTSVGQYRIVDLVGHGGMGEVYVAFQGSLERNVALKSIRPEQRLDPLAQARLLREARILSQLQHPRICQIHDYVAHDQRHFLVLELVQGRGLREVLSGRPTRALAMRIAEQIAEVLVAAHGKGVVHRDLKPENVMLTPENDVKVLDFGLARSLSVSSAPDAETPSDSPEPAAASGAAVVTTHGTVLGSVGYMSPEQARGEAATTASDMYSFGLMLQELFTGQPAYDAALDMRERLEQARKGESQRVTGLDSDLAALIERLKAAAPAARPTAVDTLSRLRFIADKPRRRARRMLISAAVAGLALLAIALAFQSRRAAREAERAGREAAAAREVSKFLVDLFEVSAPERAQGATITARQLLDRGAERIERELAGQPLTQATLMATMGVIYDKLGLYAQAEPLLEKALATRERLLGPKHPLVAESCHDLGNLYLFRYLRKKEAESERLLERAVKVRAEALGPEHPDVARSLVVLGILRYNLKGEHAAGEADLKRAVAILEKAFGPDDVVLLQGLRGLGRVHQLLGRSGEAESEMRRALAISEKKLGPEDLEVAVSLVGLANHYDYVGRYAEAAALHERALKVYEKAYGSEHRIVADVVHNLGLVRAALGEHAAAEALHTRALEIRKKSLGAEHPNVAASLAQLAAVRLAQRRPAEAERLFERARALVEAALGPDHIGVAASLRGLADARLAQGRADEARPLYLRALAIAEKHFGPEHASVAEALAGLAAVSQKQKRGEEALGLYRRSLAAYEKALGPAHPRLAAPLLGLASLLRERGDPAEAEALLRRAARIGSGRR